MTAKMEFFTQVKRLGMIKHVVDDVEQSNLQRLGMIQNTIYVVDKSNLHFSYQIDC